MAPRVMRFAQLDGIIGKFLVTPASEPDIGGLEILPSALASMALGDKAYLSKERQADTALIFKRRCAKR